MNELILPPTCYVVFVDETGHEQLRDPHHPVFGLGGCGLLVRDLEHVIRRPWQQVRQAVLGSTDAPLHASALRAPSKANIEAIAGFFRTGNFARIGVACTDRTVFPQSVPPVEIIAGALKNGIVEVARWTQFTELAVVFEHSERSSRELARAIGEFHVAENGQELVVNCYEMLKSAGEPALEVADFTMHATGRQARRSAKGVAGFVPDFAATYP